MKFLAVLLMANTASAFLFNNAIPLADISYPVCIPKVAQRPKAAPVYRYIEWFSSSINEDVDNEDDSDLEEEEEPAADVTAEPRRLDSLEFKTFDVETIENKVQKGQIILKPFYQRGYKWTQSQASAYIESILYGYPCIPHVIFLCTLDKDKTKRFAVFDGQQRLTSIMLYRKNRRRLVTLIF